MPKTQPVDDELIAVYTDAITESKRCYELVQRCCFPSPVPSGQIALTQPQRAMYMTIYECALKELRVKKKQLERGW